MNTICRALLVLIADICSSGWSDAKFQRLQIIVDNLGTLAHWLNRLAKVDTDICDETTAQIFAGYIAMAKSLTEGYPATALETIVLDIETTVADIRLAKPLKFGPAIYRVRQDWSDKITTNGAWQCAAFQPIAWPDFGYPKGW